MSKRSRPVPPRALFRGFVATAAAPRPCAARSAYSAAASSACRASSCSSPCWYATSLLPCRHRLNIGTRLPGKPGTPKLLFDGAGFAFPFYLGVSCYLRERCDTRACDVFGMSAGNIAALMLLLPELHLETWLKHYLEFEDQMVQSPCGGLLDNLQPVRRYLERLLPTDVHLRLKGRLHVVLSPWPCLGYHFLSEFRSKEEVIDAVLASCTQPGFVWRPGCFCKHRGWRGLYIDPCCSLPTEPLAAHFDAFVSVSRSGPNCVNPPHVVREWMTLPTLPHVRKMIDLGREAVAGHLHFRSLFPPAAGWEEVEESDFLT
eukprot:NODE_1265_length_1189_cov_247.433862.p1 GENE.NODE_1265_length_1189_cov_247.433862~~NODE_1265_length_1189_cov_247.433862.p1  ORF type:complete len:358 (+),score=55.83 NODE_1265_length_1189_cov_247.433862:125-1075(+)